MSDSDSFINEVSEEVRRDALYRNLRKYGWLAVVGVFALVGGAAWNEYAKAQAISEAQATGDALLVALNMNDPTERATALEGVQVDGAAVSVTALLTAAAQQEDGDLAGSVATLDALAVNADVPEIYRDLAAFKSAMIDGGQELADRRLSFEALAQPGATFSLLAQEQLALMDIAAGDIDAAKAKLEAIAQDAGVTRGLRERSQTLIVAMGFEIEPDATTDDTEEQASE